jgi:hypothetical protein
MLASGLLALGLPPILYTTSTLHQCSLSSIIDSCSNFSIQFREGLSRRLAIWWDACCKARCKPLIQWPWPMIFRPVTSPTVELPLLVLLQILHPHVRLQPPHLVLWSPVSVLDIKKFLHVPRPLLKICGIWQSPSFESYSSCLLWLHPLQNGLPITRLNAWNTSNTPSLPNKVPPTPRNMTIPGSPIQMLRVSSLALICALAFGTTK